MAELSIMKAFCADKVLYVKYGSYIRAFKNAEREIKLMFNLIEEFYQRYEEAEEIKKDELIQFYDYQYPSSRDRDMVMELITDIYQRTVRLELVQDLIEQYVEKHYAAQIVNKLFPVMEGTKSGVLSEIKADLEQYHSLLANPPVDLTEMQECDVSIEELIQIEISNEGLRWPWRALTEIIGGIRRKSLGLVFAYVDSGKTSFGIECCTAFAKQIKDTGETIVYAGNEEAATRINLRMTQSFLHCLRSDIVADPQNADYMRRELGFSRIKLYDSITHKDQVDKLLDMHNPRVLIIDQGTKIQLGGESKRNEVGQLQDLFNYYRERGKQYDTSILCLAQATGEAENKKYLKMTDLYNSKVAIQGELDYAIAIGRLTDDNTKKDLRYINIPKNKMLEGENGKLVLSFVKERCLFEAV